MVFLEPTHVFLDEMIGNHDDCLAFELRSLPGVSKVTISVVTLFSLASEVSAKLFGHIVLGEVCMNVRVLVLGSTSTHECRSTGTWDY
jgi:hypothetical protein